MATVNLCLSRNQFNKYFLNEITDILNVKEEKISDCMKAIHFLIQNIDNIDKNLYFIIEICLKKLYTIEESDNYNIKYDIGNYIIILENKLR